MRYSHWEASPAFRLQERQAGELLAAIAQLMEIFAFYSLLTLESTTPGVLEKFSETVRNTLLQPVELLLVHTLKPKETSRAVISVMDIKTIKWTVSSIFLCLMLTRFPKRSANKQL